MGNSQLPSASLKRIVTRHAIALAPVLSLLAVIALGSISYRIFINGSLVLPTYTIDPALLEGHQPPNSFIEGARRVSFHATILLQLLTIIASVGIAIVVGSYNMRWISRRSHLWLRIAAFALLAAMLALFLGDINAHSRLNVEMYEQTIKSDPALAKTGDNLILTKIAVSTMVIWAAILLAGAVSAISYRILRMRRASPTLLHKTARAQSCLLVCGAALLITQVFTSHAWENWVASYAPESVAKDVAALGSATVVAIGIFGSAALAGIYLPARALAIARIRIAAYLAVGKRDPEAVGKWIKSNGLQATIGGQLGKLAVMLGPAMAGGVFEVLGKIQ